MYIYVYIIPGRNTKSVLPHVMLATYYYYYYCKDSNLCRPYKPGSLDQDEEKFF